MIDFFLWLITDMGEAEALDKAWLVGRGGDRESTKTGVTANCNP